MERIRNLFRGLRWKLTLSYTIVTVAVMLAIQIMAIALLWMVFTRSDIYPMVVIAAVKSFLVTPVIPYLDDTEPDVIGLQRWLVDAAGKDFSFKSPQNPSVTLKLGDLDQHASLMVLDAELMYLAGYPEPDQSDLKAFFETSGDVLTTALRGEDGHSKLSSTGSNQDLIVAVPVIGESNKVLGVIVLKMSFLPRGSLPQAFALIGGSLLLFTLFAGAIGTVFGFITARGLSRRLNTVSTTADSWSRGDFTVFIGDRSEDELGQMANRLNLMAEQLQNLLETRQELATMKERNRLARDLHDSVKQQVFAIGMQVGAAQALVDQDSQASKAHLEEAGRLTRQAQQELSALIQELRPAMLEGKGLVPALREFSSNWSRQNNIPLDLLIPEEVSLPSPVERTLFRFSQEALANIAKHSGASAVEFRLGVEGDECTLEIADNGCGFEPEEVEGKGMGLHIMRERLEALNGSLTVESQPGKGTRLVARCVVE
jgi:NarL family two-component system sensor histidine kinase LiaS